MKLDGFFNFLLRVWQYYLRTSKKNLIYRAYETILIVISTMIQRIPFKVLIRTWKTVLYWPDDFFFLLCWYIANRESICNESSCYNHTWWIALSIRGRTTLHLIVVEVLLLFVLILKLGSMETREPHWMATGCCLSSLNLIWISGIDKWKEDGDSYYGHQTSLDPSFAILKGLLLFWS
jgi:hypothetical protein